MNDHRHINDMKTNPVAETVGTLLNATASERSAWPGGLIGISVSLPQKLSLQTATALV